jgi:hypothetical protein
MTIVFNSLAILAIVDSFFNLGLIEADSLGGLAMAIPVFIDDVKSFIPSSVRGSQCDGIVDGKPVNVRRLKSGGLMPSIDSIFQTSMGTAQVVGTYGHHVVIEIFDYNDDYEFEIYDIKDGVRYVSDVLDAREHLKMLAVAHNRSMDSLESDIRRIEVTLDGNVTKDALQRIENLPRLERDQMIFDATADFEFDGFVSVICDEVPTERETVAQQQARLRRERRAAKKLADEMLENLEIPEDIQAEMDAEFGAEF